MSTIDDGGPAFPMQDSSAIHSYAAARVVGELDAAERDRLYALARAEAVGGMSLRAYIAVHRPAPEEIRADSGAVLGHKAPRSTDYVQMQDYWIACAKWEAEAKAAYSVMQADALIAALKMPQQKIDLGRIDDNKADIAERINKAAGLVLERSKNGAVQP